jgi:hypothetical protein
MHIMLLIRQLSMKCLFNVLNYLLNYFLVLMDSILNGFGTDMNSRNVVTFMSMALLDYIVILDCRN